MVGIATVSASKKTPYAEKHHRPDVARRRQAWLETQSALDPARLLFIDETGVTTKMARRYGRARRGKLCHALVPGQWKTTTLSAALGLDGLRAPMVLDAPMTGAAVLAYVEQIVVPELRAGDVLVMDNVSSHRVKGVAEVIEAVGGKCLFLPLYSPDFNPIEQVFAKLKALLPQVAARTVEELWQAVADVLDAFRSEECANYFRNAGYGLS